jgi:type II secretory pathway pseudopilin PulG
LRASKTGSRGFSVVEVLIAATIFLVLAVGILPLFTQSITSNLAGREATDTSNYGRSQVEQFLQLSYEHPDLRVPDAGTVMTTQEYWSTQQNKWVRGAPPTTDRALWLRTTNVRQFQVQDIEDDGYFNTPLDGTRSTQAHLKEIEVVVRSARGEVVLGANRQMRMRMLKAK